MQGVRNIFNIFKLDGIEKCKELISEDMVEEMLSNVYDDIRPSGDDSLWVYLMRYERHFFLSQRVTWLLYGHRTYNRQLHVKERSGRLYSRIYRYI